MNIFFFNISGENVRQQLTGNKEVHREGQSGEWESVRRKMSGEQHIVNLPNKDNNTAQIFLK